MTHGHETTGDRAGPPPDRVKAIFLEAVGLDAPAERSAYLDAACGGDPALRARVERLLRAGDEPEARLAPVPFELALEGLRAVAPDAAAALADPVGGRVGPYRLVRWIGEGGMGVVYEAEQEEPVRRRVALKLIKPGMDTRQVIARFEAERQALARLDHPGIARVLDAGATPLGRPYFVMELVDGPPITQYCDRERLTLPRRLELFAGACGAVHHAHRRGILHRDLKPSNLLVATGDGTPLPKVIDFGIAKALGDTAGGHTALTEPLQLLGTPLYMSPEQATGAGADVDTRSDVYSLGVVLYELLTGTTPIAADRFLGAGREEVGRLLREEDPPRPSARLAAPGAATDPVAAAAARRLDPQAHRRALRGDLDWIVMKATEKDRRRRYDTPAELAEDLGRHLRGEAVLAGPRSRRYRAGRFARRHRVPLAAATMVLLAIVAGAGLSVRQAIRATKAEREAVAAKRSLEGALTVAQAAQRLSDRHLHAVRLTLAGQALDAGEIERAQNSLDQARPGIGEGDPRDFPWYYLRRRARRDLVCLPAGPGAMLAHSASRDRRVVVSAHGRGAPGPGPATRLVAWDLGTEASRELPALAGHDEHGLVRVSADGRLVAVLGWSGGRGRLWVLRIADGRVLAEAEAWPDSRSRGAEFLDWLDGDRLLALGRAHPDEGASLRVWRVDGFLANPAAPPALDLDGLVGFAFDPAAPVVAAWEPDRLALRELPTGRELRSWPLAGPAENAAVALDLAVRRIALTQPGRGVVLRDTDTGDEVGHHDPGAPVRRLEFAPGGRTLAIVDEPGLIHLWQLGTDHCDEVRADDREGPRDVWFAFSPDGRHLATASFAANGHRPVRLWDARTGTPLGVKPGTGAGGAPFAFAADGRLLILAGDRAPCLWKLEPDPEGPAVEGHAAQAWCAAFSPDGRTLATGGDDVGDPLTIRLHDVATGETLRAWKGHPGTVAALAFSPDGRTLATAALADSDNLTLWDPATDEPRSRLVGHTEGVRAVAYSPDGKALASGGSDRTVRLWNSATGQCLWIGRDHTDKVRALAFAPDGKALASAANDGRVRLWDVATGRVVREFAQAADLCAVAYAPDGRTVAAAGMNGVITIWDLHGRGGTREILADAAPLLALAFAPDGKTLATAGEGRTIGLWDPLTGERMLELEGSADQVNGLAFSPDGRTLASCAHDGAVRLWTTREAPPFEPRPRPAPAPPDRTSLAAAQPPPGAAPGSLDPTFAGGRPLIVPFDLGGDREDRAVAVKHDPESGGVVVAGQAANPAWTPDAPKYDAIVQLYRADGTLDPAFGSGGTVRLDAARSQQPLALAVHRRGIYVVVAASPTPGRMETWIYRLGPDGRPDPDFTDNDGLAPAGVVRVIFGSPLAPADGGRPREFATCQSISLHPRTGDVYVAGSARPGPDHASAVTVAAKILAGPGRVDRKWGENGRRVIDVVPGQPDGADGLAVGPEGEAYLAVGAAEPTDRDFLVLKLTPHGAPDESFGKDLGLAGVRAINFDALRGGRAEAESPYGIVLGRDADGPALYIAGEVVIRDRDYDFGVAKLRPDGRLDPTFGVGGRALVPFNRGGQRRDIATAIAFDPADGSITLAGWSDSPRGEQDTDLAAARLTPAGVLDPAFGDGGRWTIDVGLGGRHREILRAVDVDDAGRLLLVGGVEKALGDDYDWVVVRLVGRRSRPRDAAPGATAAGVGDGPAGDRRP